ncbi:MAG: hypothetical protein HYY06_10515 [Deltaproteobacteria bacterium]|nr:hypothetical protein [Deltaproteobacteria bacterium]
MRSFLKQAFAIVLVLLVTSCEGGGCSGCEGCGIEQIPGGFPLENRIENAGQIRLTSHGIDFIEANLGEIIGAVMPGGLSFAIPQSSMDLAGNTVEVCPNGDCWADAELTDVSLEPTNPNILAVAIRLILRTRNLQIGLEGGDILCAFQPPLGCCDIDVDTTYENPEDVGVTLDVVFSTDLHTGYTKVEVNDPQVGDDLTGGDIQISAGGGGDCGCLIDFLCDLVNIDFLKDLLIPLLVDQLGSQLSGPIQDQLCRQCQDVAACPNGNGVVSACNDGTCEYDDGSCVPILLGMEGQADLGSLLASVTPGLEGRMRFTFASGGDGEAGRGQFPRGLNLNFFGGLDSLEHNRCVPLLPQPERPTIPLATAIRRDETPGGSDSMVNIGISEDYLNWSSYGVFDSGMLCIGAGVRLSQSLSTGLFSLVFASLADVVYPAEKAPVALQLRPQNPPFIDVGSGVEDDPLLGVFLDDLMIDFYAFAEDRYVRFMTVQVDMGLAIDLEIGPDGILPVIGDPEISNVVVTNSELMQESPEDIAAVFADLIGIAVGTFLGSIEPFPIPDLMGFELDVPEGGITRVTELDSDFLAIFANLAFAADQASYETETHAELADLAIDPSAFDLVPGWRDKLPVARLRLSSEESAREDVEFSYRVDEQTWSHWSRETEPAIRAKSFLLQGEHTIEVRSRLAGQPRTGDRTPARLDFTIDTRPPRLDVDVAGSRVTASAVDVVAKPEELEYSFRVDDGAWSRWTQRPWVDAPRGAAVEVRARDRSGNESSARVDPSGIIRGRPSTTNPPACECGAAPGAGGGTSTMFLFGLGALLCLVVARRRARRSWRLLALVPFLATAGGCDCAGGAGDDDDPVDAGPDSSVCGDCGDSSECCESTGECVASPDYGCDPGYACDPASGWDAEACEWAESCECVPLPPIDPGFIGSYTDFARAADGTVWVSGYEEGQLRRDPFGDLVVGTWQTDHVEWAIVDGLPEDGDIVADPTGWRGGTADPGPDVGRYTSLVLGPNDSPRVAYYDVTNGDLKFAMNDDGTWITTVVDETGDSGRWASMVALPDLTPAIAYWATVPDPEAPGRFVGRAMYAQADGPNPGSWTRTVLHQVPVPCRPWYCAEGEECAEAGNCFIPAECDPECADGEACDAGVCVTTLSPSFIEDWPEGTGLYASLRVDPSGNPGVAYYDHTDGDLYRSSFDGAAWTTELVDGFFDGVDTGDVGLSSTLAIDAAGVWHVAYVDGWSESLMYLAIGAGAPEIADDGFRDDGLHLVGDDAHVAVAEDGTVTIVYQDATAGTLEQATRALDGAWTHETIDGAKATGFFPKHIGDGTVGCYFRDFQADPPVDGVRLITP